MSKQYKVIIRDIDGEGLDLDVLNGIFRDYSLISESIEEIKESLPASEQLGTCQRQWVGHIEPHAKQTSVCINWQPLTAQSPVPAEEEEIDETLDSVCRYLGRVNDEDVIVTWREVLAGYDRLQQVRNRVRERLKGYGSIKGHPAVSELHFILREIDAGACTPIPAEGTKPEIWRVGRKLGRTLYIGDHCIGIVDTPELAAKIVESVNINNPTEK